MVLERVSPCCHDSVVSPGIKDVCLRTDHTFRKVQCMKRASVVIQLYKTQVARAYLYSTVVMTKNMLPSDVR